MAIKKNQVVTMQYELKVNGEVIESNLDADPIEFIYGKGEILGALEENISNMNENEEKTIKVSAEEAYGEYDETLTEIVPISEFEGIDLSIGMVLEADGDNGEIFKATVIEVTKDSVTVDYNHPLAGAELEFKVRVGKIA